MTEICNLKQIAEAMSRSEKTVRRLAVRKVIVLHKTATGHYWCYKRELKEIISQYLNVHKCP